MRLIFLFAALMPLAAVAEAPLDVTNLATLARGFPLPVLGYTQALTPGTGSMTAMLDVVNEFHANSSPDETIRIDGETQRLAVTWRRGFASGYEFGVELPFYFQNGGMLDDIVTGFHSAIGQSNTSRDRFPARKYAFRYERPNGSVLLDRQSGSDVIGDLSLYGGWQFQPDLVLRTQLKLPTGPASRLAGNGAASASVWADYAMPWFEKDSAFSGFLSGGTGYSLLGDVLRTQQERWILFGGGGLAWRATSSLRLLAQVYAHSKLYKESGFDLLAAAPLIVSVGLRWKLGSDTELQVSFIEDAFVSPAPDYAMRLGLNWRL
ncbi:MAG: DUF3187 family protein [Pseudomonadota bacterium]